MKWPRTMMVATVAVVLAYACGREAFHSTNGNGGALNSTSSNSIGGSAISALSLNGLVVDTGTNECLVASLAVSSSASNIALAWGTGGNAQPMTVVVTQTSGSGALLPLETLIAPHPGSLVLAATWSGVANAVLGAVSFSGADQRTCVGNAGSSQGDSTSPSITVSGEPGSLTMAVSLTAGPVVTVSQTRQWNQSVAAGSSGAATFVQQAFSGSEASAQLVNLPGDVATGDTLVACVSFDTGQTGVKSIDGGGVTWTQVAVGPNRTALWVGTGSTGANGAIQVEFSGSDNCAAHVSEWSGILGNPLDGVVLNAGKNSTLTTGTLSTTNPDDLLFACGAQDKQTAGIPSNGFAALDAVDNQSEDDQEEAWEQVSSTGSWSTGWTLANNSDQSEAILAAFKTGGATAPLASGASTAAGSATYTFETTASGAWAAAGVEILPGP